MSLSAAVRAVRGHFTLDVAVAADPGEVVAVVGPNGAGKSTLVLVLAGLEPMVSGRVVLDGEVLDDTAAGVHVPAERRSVGVVFQDYLLFPHLCALDNVAFGLVAAGAPRSGARRVAAGLLEEMGLAARGNARPGDLSGGEAQRVALARALAVRPRLLLLDEPLSALDAAARPALRSDLRRHLAGFDGIRLLVTHDPLDATALADRIVVVEGGVVVQSGTTSEVAAHPRTRYVADLVGVNLLRGVGSGSTIEVEGGGTLAVADHVAGEAFAVFHPRTVVLHRDRPEGSSRNVWQARVGDLHDHGDRIRVRLVGPIPVVAEVTSGAAAELALGPGTALWCSLKATEVEVFPA
jgi:molybdate transport system ATP-binding protein